MKRYLLFGCVGALASALLLSGAPAQAIDIDEDTFGDFDSSEPPTFAAATDIGQLDASAGGTINTVRGSFTGIATPDNPTREVFNTFRFSLPRNAQIVSITVEFTAPNGFFGSGLTAMVIDSNENELFRADDFQPGVTSIPVPDLPLPEGEYALSAAEGRGAEFLFSIEVVPFEFELGTGVGLLALGYAATKYRRRLRS